MRGEGIWWSYTYRADLLGVVLPLFRFRGGQTRQAGGAERVLRQKLTIGHVAVAGGVPQPLLPQALPHEGEEHVRQAGDLRLVRLHSLRRLGVTQT
eukprot:8306884-Pyramimonas_sp.AAC.1